MLKTDFRQQAREFYKNNNWKKAYNCFFEADKHTRLLSADLEQFALSAYLTGDETESTDILARAYNSYHDENNIAKAIYCAFWIGMICMNLGEKAQGSGWADRLIEGDEKEYAEKGFLLVPPALQYLREGQLQKAYNLFEKASKHGLKYSNRDLVTLGQLGCGQALILDKKVGQGTKLFDEAMLDVISDDTSPLITGIVYCAVIEACQKIFDLERAREWTNALSKWCAKHKDLVSYRGQ